MTLLDHALSLAARGFKVFPILPWPMGDEGSEGKCPAVKFKTWATDDAAKLQSAWTRYPDSNIGIYTGVDLLVVDVDNKGNKNGSATVLGLEIAGFDFPETFTTRTPTGGEHYFYRVAAPVKQGADVLGKGVDVRSRGGYVVGPGSTIDGRSYEISVDAPVADAPAWLIERCGRSKDRPERPQADPVPVDQEAALRRALHYLKNEAPIALEGAAGDQTTYKVAARVKDFGLDAQQCFGLMQDGWNARCQPPWGLDELWEKVRNAYRYGNETPGAAAPEADFEPVVSKNVQKTDTFTERVQPADVNNKHPFDKLNSEFAFVIAGGGAHILWETTDAKDNYALEHLSMYAFNMKFKAKKFQVGKKAVDLTDAWLEWEGRRSFDGIVFSPGLEAPSRFYNLWRGFSVEPGPAGKHPAVDMFLDHARDNVCQGDLALYRWLMGWFAHLIQRPWEKPLVALVFKGAKGVGKNALIDRIGHLLGNHYLLTSNKRYLTGNFNSHLEACLMLALDEAFWSGDKSTEGIIKDLITGREHVIEHKGKEPYKVDNRTRVVVIGNEEWIVPASHDERRFAVFSVGAGRKQDREYFQQMREGMEAGGYAVLLRYLLDFDLSGIDINAAPNTQALVDQKVQSLDNVHTWWLNCLEQGVIAGADFEDWPPHVECSRMQAAFRRFCQDRRVTARLPDPRAFGKELKKCAPSVEHVRKSRQSDGSQPYVYTLPAIDKARADWDTFIGRKGEWE